jgi:hypothetical protein
MVDQDLRFSYHALLIGIDAYSEKPLKGCVRDVHEIKKHLDGIPKPGVQTHVLTASLATNTTSSRLTEESRFWPTHRKVVDTINHITYHAKEGDFVYIHFSGHGTALRPPRESSPSRIFSNPSTGDLALSLLQEDGSKTQYLRGSELAYLLRGMVNKKLIVTLVLDCCFSGSIMRNDASVRYLDYDQQIDAAHPPVPGRSLSSEDELRHPAYRNASLGPNWLVNPDRYTVITACGPTEVAKEIRIGDQAHGVLSYFLADTFRKFGGIGGKHRHIYQWLRTRLQETRGKYRHNQNPMLYGNKDLYFFGRVNMRIEPAPIPVIKNQDGSVQLEAGQAHGICEGDKFAVSAVAFTGLATPEIVSHKISGTAEVTSVGALTSNLRFLETVVTNDTTLSATALTHLSLKRFLIRLEIGVPYPEGWVKALDEKQTLCIYNACNENQKNRCSFTVAMPDPGSYEIRDETDHTLLSLPASSIESKEDATLVLESVEHLAKFELVKALTNNSLVDLTDRFRRSFSVQLIKPAGDRIDPGCLQAGQHQSICSHPECLVGVENGTFLQLEVKNYEEEGGHAICVHVYSMSSSWEIENILGGDYEVIPPRSSNQGQEFRKGTSGIWKKKILMTVPPALREKGEKQCVDIFKVFLTSQPTSFMSLELPELGNLLERSKVSKYRGGGAYSSSKDWFALSFRIRTHFKEA